MQSSLIASWSQVSVKQARSGFSSVTQRVISSILGARDIVLDSSRLGPKTGLLNCFAESVVVAGDWVWIVVVVEKAIGGLVLE